MAKQDFIPKTEGEFVNFHDAFKTQFALIATILGFGANDVSATNTDNTRMHTDVTTAAVKKADSHAANAAKRETFATITEHVRRIAARAKTHQNYTEAYGRQLGIIGPEESGVIAPDKPDLRAELVQQGNIVRPRVMSQVVSRSLLIISSQILLLFLFLDCASSSAFAALSDQDDTSLTLCLEDISVRWVQPSVDLANTILSRPQYTAADWESWFDNYFNTTGHPLTDALAEYLWYPVFGWFDDTIHLKLQAGLTNPIWAKATAPVATHTTDLGPTLYADPNLRQSVFNAHAFFAHIGEKGLLDSTAKDTIYERYKGHIRGYPQYYSNVTTIDNFAQPLISLLRAQVWVCLGDTLPLTESLKTDIAQTIDLTSGPLARKGAIWDVSSVLLIDNNQLNEAQLDFVGSLLEKIPTGLSNLRYVTVRDFLSATGWNPYPIVLKGQTGNLINYYLYVQNSGQPCFGFDGAAGSWPGVLSTRAVTWDTWNHVAATYDGSIIRVFLNGLESASLAAAGVPISISREPLRIGHMPDFNHWLRGTLDDVKVYGRALSVDEISREYRSESVSTSGLVGYWMMDESSGTLVADASGLGHHGVCNGAVSVSGKSGNGLFFEGKDDDVVVGDEPDLRLGQSLTVEAWVYLVNEQRRWLATGSSWDGGGWMVNIGGLRLGQANENSFPDDIAPKIVDIFCGIAIHEVNHVVDATSIWTSAVLRARKTQLIAQAGQEPMQYLRSMVTDPDGTSFFPEAPQEFFASISNEYFTDSWHTLDLALSRFDRGYREPINQFLFFVDVYSKGGPSTKVYTTDAAARITVEDARIGRDAHRHIDRLRHGANVYRFALDSDGDVTSWTLANSDTERSDSWQVY